MYDDGKILYAGGGRTTNTAEVIDLNQSAPGVALDGLDGICARRHLNAHGAPHRRGGSDRRGGRHRRQRSEYARFTRRRSGTPRPEQWTTLASNAIPRGYHSTSLLLPDGRVLHAGSGGAAGAVNQLQCGALLAALPLSGAAAGDHERAFGGAVRQSVPDSDAAGVGHHPGEPHQARSGDARLRREPALQVAVVHQERDRTHRDGARTRGTGRRPVTT